MNILRHVSEPRAFSKRFLRREVACSPASPNATIHLIAMRVVIVGAGIGGLAAAVALRRVGVESLVIERVPEIQEVGAGLSLWSNAVHALREIGVESKVMASASVVERLISKTPDGRLLAETDLTAVSREAGAPCICVHRAVLQR